MSNQPEYVQKFVRFLEDMSWHRCIQGIITSFLQGNRDSQSLDNLMMAVTKSVETDLREAVARHISSSVPSKHSYGIKLLDFAVNRGLIRSRQESIYGLLGWIFIEQRNTSHHRFTRYPYRTLTLHVLEANEALEQIERLVGNPYDVRFTAKYDDGTKKIAIEAEIRRPDGVLLPGSQKADCELVSPDGTRRTVPLNYGSGQVWRGEYGMLGLPYGTLWLNVAGVDEGMIYHAASGNTIGIASVVTIKCKCGNDIPPGAWTCSKCDKTLVIL